jgi:membrane protease YdiL (CAAX protease family)
MEVSAVSQPIKKPDGLVDARDLSTWRKGAAVLEVVVVFILAAAFGRWRYAATAEVLGSQAQAYVSGVVMVAIAALLVFGLRRDPVAYGYTLRRWRRDLDVGMTAYLVRFISWIPGLGLLLLLDLSYRSLPGALLLAIATSAEIIVMLAVLQRRGRTEPRALPNLIILLSLLALPIALAALRRGPLGEVVFTVVWQFLFSGFGEEMLYRGYMQSRLNQAFGRPYTIRGVRFGPGLILASLVFALSHVLNTYNPFVGSYELSWGWGIWTFVTGLLFGIIREGTDGLLAPAIAHGLPDAVGEAFAIVFGWQL